MNINIGIIGLTQSGKSTVFNALTGGKAEGRGTAPHTGTAQVPEPRLKVLADMLQPKRVVSAEISYIDIGASVKGPSGDRTIGGPMLAQVGNADALINVVRAFGDETVPHVEGSVDAERDIAATNLELTLYDADIVSRRLDKIADSQKGAKPHEKAGLAQEEAQLSRLRNDLEKERPIRELEISADEARMLAGYQYLTAKPLLIAVNIGEEQIDEAAAMESELGARYGRHRSAVITLCGKLEMELTRLDEQTAGDFRAEYGLSAFGRERIIKASYELLGLNSFFTVVSGDMRAWPLPRGTTALKAAGRIHSDMERGFIRAEVISYHDLLKCGSFAEAHKRGLARLEGKGYVVQDGDIITFLFNV